MAKLGRVLAMILVLNGPAAVARPGQPDHVARTLNACVPMLTETQAHQVARRLVERAVPSYGLLPPLDLGVRAGRVLREELAAQAAGRAPDGERWREFITLWLVAQRQMSRATATRAERIGAARSLASWGSLSFAIVQCAAAVTNLQHALTTGQMDQTINAIFGFSALGFGSMSAYTLYSRRAKVENVRLLPGAARRADAAAADEKAREFLAGLVVPLDEVPEAKGPADGRRLLDLVRRTWPPAVTIGQCPGDLPAKVIED